MTQISIEVVDVKNKTALKRFVALERRLLQAFPKYISEIDSDVIKLFNGTDMTFRQMHFCLFIATANGNDVARCAAIINPQFQAEKQPGASFIGFFAAAAGQKEAVDEMIAAAENWLRQQGATHILAPGNGGAPQALGVLVNRYDEDPMFPFPWHPPYYKTYWEQLHYKAAYPLWYYEIDLHSEAYQAAAANRPQPVVHFRTISKKNWNNDIATLTHLLNETFVEEWEFTQADPAAMQSFFGPMKSLLEAEQISFVESHGRAVGFCFAMPDLTPLFRSFQGKIGLLSILKLLTQGKKYHRAGILGIGVINEFKGLGISKAMALQVLSFYKQKGLRTAMYYPVNESNTASRKLAESLGGKGVETYRVYSKTIQP